MKFYLRIIFFIIVALVFKIIFDIPTLPKEVHSLQDALNSKYLIQDNEKLIINMKNVLKAKNPKNILDRLVQLGGDINAQNEDGSTPLIVCARNGDKEMVSYILAKGTNSDSALFHFLFIKNHRAARLLVKCGANVNAQDEAGSTPLHYAIMMSFKEVIDSLTAHGLVFDQSIRDVHSIKQTIKLVTLLLLHGANPNATVNDVSALAYALITSNAELVKLLLNYGANPNIKSVDEKGLTPLMQCLLKDDSEVVNLLLEKGADVNQQDNTGKTALFHVKNKAIAELLIDKCTDINFRDNKGYTALNWAAHQNNEEIVQFLLSKGADATIKNNAGHSALDSVKIG